MIRTFLFGSGAIIAGATLALILWESLNALIDWEHDRAARRIGRRATDA